LAWLRIGWGKERIEEEDNEYFGYAQYKLGEGRNWGGCGGLGWAEKDDNEDTGMI
jgi:hypothetical protein